MSDYTPSMTNAQNDYVLGRVTNHRRTTAEQAIDITPYSAEFDRFINKVKADALREAAEATRAEAPGEPHAGATFISHARWLDERANRIEGES